MLLIDGDGFQGSANTFSARSCYNLLLDLRQVEVAVDSDVLEAVKILWKNVVASKVSFFGWRLLFDRLPTRKALNHRGILVNSHDLSCIFCFRCVEDCAHLFFHCPFSKRVWDAVFTWVGKCLPGGVDGWNHFSLYGNLFKNRKGERTSHLIWMATT
jgi:hypothetical protein